MSGVMSFLLDHWHLRPSQQLTKQSSMAGRLAKDIFGISDIQRGVANIQKGNLLKGVGQAGLGALIGGLTFIPMVGWGAKGLLAGGRLGLNFLRGGKILRGAEKAAQAKKLAGTRALMTKNPARQAGYKNLASGRSVEGKDFRTFMNSQFPEAGAGKGGLFRGAWEASNVALRGTKQQHAFRAAAPNNIAARIGNRLGAGADASKLRTGLGRFAARHPMLAQGGLIAGGSAALGGAANTVSAQPPVQGSPLNLAGLAAGTYQKPSWLR